MKAIEVFNISKAYAGTEVLSDISFEVKQGETVGIIGPNGAGKSTLLKILSGIVRPSSGKAIINGSVSSILEVGMGFHPELTGYENVFFVGQIMGYGCSHIQSKLVDIIQFSELHDHMDKMVKFYSSGMYLRLAFSIYTMLESDILLMDEVLSVGDAAFKRKSYDWMTGLKSKDKSLVLVSHNLSEIQSFCDRVIYIDKVVRMDSQNIRECILNYQRDHPENQGGHIESSEPLENSRSNGVERGRTRLNPVKLAANDFLCDVSVSLHSNSDSEGSVFMYDNEIGISIKYKQLVDDAEISFILKLFDMNDSLLVTSAPDFKKDNDGSMRDATSGFYEERSLIPSNFLNVGRYYLTLTIGVNNNYLETVDRVLHFDVEQNDWMVERIWSNIPSPILTSFEWEKKKIE